KSAVDANKKKPSLRLGHQAKPSQAGPSQRTLGQARTPNELNTLYSLKIAHSENLMNPRSSITSKRPPFRLKSAR
ncbi:hypothetical protein, partial [Paenibacillus marchantiophytorum]|uniref:hypothetical protein n=1 Tax=Paenibacillus marchantiophytorum TaxID=1619310 RepID=UPI001E2F07A7